MKNARLFLVAAIALVSYDLKAQSIGRIATAFDGEKVTLTFDLIGKNADDKFRLQVFNSVDNFQTPMVFDAPLDNVASGLEKVLVWNAKKFLPSNFDADVSFKVVALPLGPAAPPAAKLSIKPLEKSSYKKGSSLSVGWAGAASTERIKINLLKGGRVVQSLGEQSNSVQNFTWHIPKKIDKAQDYSLEIASSKERQASSPFAIKSKPPILLIAIPIVVAGVAVAVLSGGGKSSNPPTPAPNNDLPALTITP